jgi:hypothetical protein
MTPDSFRNTFPAIFSLLRDSPLDDDIAAAITFAEEGEESLRDALEAKLFKLNEMMWLLAGAISLNFTDPDAVALENSLSAVIAQVGIDVARRTYRDKLLVDDRKTFEDTRYEIAVTSKACAVLDPGSVQLEKPIPDHRKQQRHWKNTDVFGNFHGQPVRIEVTVLHESLPGVVHLELDDMVKAADTPLGFSLALRSLLVDEGYAERVRAMLELLAEAHTGSCGKDEEIDGVKFRWNKGAYHCDQDTSPFKSIVFYDADEFPGAASLREITHPCSVRAVTPRFILEDHPNPPGVITSADLPDAPTQVPVSTKVHQMLAGKLQQCEQGVVNIIAFGNPRRMHDREVSNAVLGVEVVTVPFTEEKSGLRQFGNATLTRNPKAPFVPAQYLANSDDCREFVDPFRKISAVWHVRFGYDTLSTCIPNPNAAVPAPDDLLAALAGIPTSDERAEAAAIAQHSRHRWVSENAYFRWRREGCPHGHDIRHWLEGETEYKTARHSLNESTSMTISERSVLGRTLSADVAALLTDIERRYGCEIVFKPSDDTSPFLGGTCTVTPEGVPEITINERNELWEEAVVHELQHLRLRKEQYPFFELENQISPFWKPGNLRNMLYGVYEPILHHVFNPAIKRMDRNPAALFNAMFRKNLEPGDIEKNTLEQAWPLVYFRILLECDDSSVRESLRLRCEGLGWGRAIERAKQMVAQVEALTEPTPEKAAETFVRCANIAFEGIFEFGVVGLEKVQKGLQTEQKVTISVAVPD